MRGSGTNYKKTMPCLMVIENVKLFGIEKKERTQTLKYPKSVSPYENTY